MDTALFPVAISEFVKAAVYSGVESPAGVLVSYAERNLEKLKLRVAWALDLYWSENTMPFNRISHLIIDRIH